MTEPASASPTAPASGYQLKVWHLSFMVAFAAFALINIRDQRLEDPKLIALAGAGFVLYGFLGWLGWRIAKRLEGRLRPVTVLILYLVGMGTLFMIATGVFLAIELAYFK